MKPELNFNAQYPDTLRHVLRSNRLRPAEVERRAQITAFTKKMQAALKEDKAWAPFARIPANRRPFYESLIRDFEASVQGSGIWTSRSGTTIQILAAWLKHEGRKFTITYQPAVDMFELEAK